MTTHTHVTIKDNPPPWRNEKMVIGHLYPLPAESTGPELKFTAPQPKAVENAETKVVRRKRAKDVDLDEDDVSLAGGDVEVK